MGEEKEQETPKNPEPTSGNKIFDPKCIDKEIEFNTAEVECPELNEFMGVTEGNVIFKVRQYTLDEFLRSKTENDAGTRLSELAVKLNDSLINKDSNSTAKQLIEAYTMEERPLPQTSMNIFLCEKCVVEPKLSHEEVVKLGKFFPTVTAKLSNKILELGDVGAVKKNS
jgi:hypothetical protein